jgi:hypothetical protein
MVRAFDPSVDGQSLIFQYNFANNTFTDKQTGSKWDFERKSIEGPLKGKQLLCLPFDEGYWFEWTALHLIQKYIRNIFHNGPSSSRINTRIRPMKSNNYVHDELPLFSFLIRNNNKIRKIRKKN